MRGKPSAILAWLSFSLPMTIALWRASGGVQWRADLPSLRDQGLAAVELGGTASLLLTQAMSVLPFGNQAFRGALAAALALGLCGLCLHRIATRLLDGELPEWTVSLLAAIAAVMATLSPTLQREGNVAGGAAVAVALALCCFDRAMLLTGRETPSLTPAATSGWLGLSALAGLTLAESVPVGIAVLLAIAATAWSANKRPPLRLWPALWGLLLAVFAAGTAGLWLRPLSPGSWSDVGRALSAASLDALAADATRKVALLAWVDEIGVVSLVLGAIGVGVSLFRPARRAWMCLLIAPLIVDLSYPLSATAGLGADPLAALRGLALAAFAVAASLGVAEVIGYLRSLAVPMARTASVLVVVFHITIVAVTCEDAAFAADRSAHLAAEEWTDEALGSLPNDAAVLVHSPALAWRLWAAQTLEDQRPDVIVIPAPLLEHGRVTANLLPSEPAVGQLLRDFALTGAASEYGLSLLADARPLFVELDHGWGERIVKHLTVDGAWLSYAPQVLGRSDRKIAKPHVLADEGRITRHILAGMTPDTPTAVVVAKTLKEHVAAMSLVGFGPETPRLLDGVERLAPQDPFVIGARLRLANAERRRRSHRSIDMRDLLPFGDPR